MMAHILVLNGGSSSVKFALYRCQRSGTGSDLDPGSDLSLAISGHFSGLDTPHSDVSLTQHNQAPLSGPDPAPADSHQDAISELIGWLSRQDAGMSLIAVGHRVVHGGQAYHDAIILDDQAIEQLEALTSLAPLHQGHGLAPIKRLRQQWPELVQVACFDTAFHANQPWQARQYALPRALTAKGLVRYGFHGLSYAYIQRRLSGVLPEQAPRARVIVAHLGNGASMCALRDGASVASSMGFTALDGLPMGSRSGSLDPGLVLHLIDQEGYSVEQASTLLYKHAGLLGVSGISSDMQVLLASKAPEAREAIELYCYRAAREIASLAGALGGVEQLVFTAGVGEHAAEVRAQIVTQCRWLGMQLDGEANRANATCISAPQSQVGVWVIPTDEEAVIAEDCLRLMTGG